MNMNFREGIEGKRVVVTGGAGFIGSNLIERLMALKCQIVVLDDFSSGTIENLPKCSDQVRIIRGDVRNASMVKKAINKSDLVFHLAEFIPNTAQGGPGHVIKFSTKRPIVDLNISVRGTINVLECAKEAGAKVVFSSTAAVYGESHEGAIDESMPLNPVSPYGASKSAAELYCKVYSHTFGLPVTVVRFFNVYGPKQRKYLMHDVLMKLRQNPQALTILGSGYQRRDFVFVRDVVDGLVLVADRAEFECETYNLGTGIATSAREVVKCITDILDLKPEIAYTGSSWKGDIKSLVADIGKIRSLGFSPKYSLQEGVKELISWFDGVYGSRVS